MTAVGASLVFEWTVGTVVRNRNMVDGRALRHLQRRFNKLFVIQKLVDTPDNQGGSTRVWSTLATVAGALEPLSAEERLARGITESTGMFTAYIAYRPNVDVRNRLMMGARVFDIKAVNDLGEQELVLGLDISERFRA